MNFTSRGLLACLCAAVPVLPGFAQGAPAQGPHGTHDAGEASATVDPESFPFAPAALGQNVGLQREADGSWRAMGPRWEVVLGDRAIELFPGLDVETSETHSVRFELLSVGRAQGATQTATRGRRVVRESDLQIRYEHGSYDEVYDVQVEGLEQSFEFRSLPAGSGDLVVRLAVATDLLPNLHGTTDGGMEFGLDPVLYSEASAAKVGAVTGIAADGTKRSGSMSYEGGVLELRLPADFVDGAALPLVLDPLLGSTSTQYSLGTWDQRNPDVAYDLATDSYLVVFEREIGTVFQIRAQRVAADGSLLGGSLGVNTSASSKFTPKVAGIRERGAWAVLWTEDNKIRGTGVGNDGAILSGASQLISGSTDLYATPDIGGSAAPIGDDATAVFLNFTTGDIEARLFTIDATMTPVVTGSIVTISSAANLEFAPCISKSGGETGNHLIVWQRTVSGFQRLRGAIVDRRLNFLDSLINITSDAVDQFDPDCDGDGRNWVVAWSRDEVADPTSQDIYCRSVFLNAAGTAGVLGSPAVGVEVHPGDDEFSPSVAWTGNAVLISFTDGESGGAHDLYVASFDPYSCARCEGSEFLVIDDAAENSWSSIVSPFSGGGTRSDAFIVWDAEDQTTFDSLVYGRMFVSEAGLVDDLGGGCGDGGIASAACARVDHSAFAHRMRGAPANSNAWLVMSFDRLDAACGPCALVANPFSGFVVATNTDPYGTAELAMPIPDNASLVGLTFFDQWFVPGAGCTNIGMGLSNAIQVTIQ